MLNLRNKSIISIRDLKKEEIELILNEAEIMEKRLERKEPLYYMKNKIMASLFFEPSTKTRLSFSAAMQRLGGSVIEIEYSTTTKNFIDKIKMIENYCDVILLRHPKEGSARLASEILKKPVINAGDGSNQHPTQTLIDLFAIRKLKGKIENLNISLIGDLKYNAVIKSLFYALGLFKVNITLASPPELQMSWENVEEVRDKFGIKIFQTNSLRSAIEDADVLYICGIKKEKFVDVFEAEKIQKNFRITPELLENAKEDMIILHPLPKDIEIDSGIDETKFAKYYEQASYGLPVRMALLSLVVG
ncbi:MAG: aspartate carbamoyltransferase [Candidatus Aenigmatarchaeota archaeon]